MTSQPHIPVETTDISYINQPDHSSGAASVAGFGALADWKKEPKENRRHRQDVLKNRSQAARARLKMDHLFQLDPLNT